MERKPGLRSCDSVMGTQGSGLGISLGFVWKQQEDGSGVERELKW